MSTDSKEPIDLLKNFSYNEMSKKRQIISNSHFFFEKNEQNFLLWCLKKKDNDFLQDGVKIMIGPEAKKSVMESLDADVAFLAKNQIMDYSLILGKDTKTF